MFFMNTFKIVCYLHSGREKYKTEPQNRKGWIPTLPHDQLTVSFWLWSSVSCFLHYNGKLIMKNFTFFNIKWSTNSFCFHSQVLSLYFLFQFSSIQLLSRVWFFATLWTAACQASLSITNSQSLLKLMSIESVMTSSYLILCHPLLLCLQSFPASGSFPVSQLFPSHGQSIEVSASASVLPLSIQSWFPLGLTGLISLQSKGLSRVFPSTTIWKHHFFKLQPSLRANSHIRTWLLKKP